MKVVPNPSQAPLGEAIRNARITIGDRIGDPVTSGRFAQRVGIHPSTYSRIENSTLNPLSHQFLAILSAYEHHPDIQRNLRVAYEALGSGPTPVEPFLSPRGDPKFDEEALTKRATAILQASRDGHVQLALHLGEELYPEVRAHRIQTPGATSVALSYASVLHQLEEVDQSVLLLRRIGDAQIPHLGRLQLCEYISNETGYSNLFYRRSPIEAAEAFKSIFGAISTFCTRSSPEDDARFKWIWNNTQRQVMIALSERLGSPEEREYVRSHLEAFEASAASTDSPSYVVGNQLIRARLEACHFDPERALEIISLTPRDPLQLADHAFEARTQIMALARLGHVERAIAHADLWINRCDELHMFARGRRFRKIRLQLVQGPAATG